MKKAFYNILLFCLLAPGTAWAHFGMILPSDDIIAKGEGRQITLEIKFLHPFKGNYLEMARPVAFGVLAHGKKIDLLSSLKKETFNGASGWDASYTVKRPGDHIFYMEPAPYWEPAEERFIVHYTKVIVSAFGLEEGWDEEIGLKTEIVPLTRPYGLWAGNVFQGVVKVDGRPVPYAEVEVEYYNQDGKVKAPDDPYITQVIKADSNGVFIYAMPREGWWGFAALSTADFKLEHGGKKYPVEIGAVLWVKTREMR